MLLPSDVARLVLGYLGEENCPQAYQNFLNESEHLGAIRQAFSTTEWSNQAPISIFGKSLYGIINEYYIMKDAELQVQNFRNRSRGRNQAFLAIWKKLEDAVATVKSFQIASLLEGAKLKKLRCRNCDSLMTDSGILLASSSPSNLIFSRPVQNQHQSNRMRSTFCNESRTSAHDSSHTSIDPNERLAVPFQESRRKKKRSIPKKLSDAQRKDKESLHDPDPSSLLLKSISGSEAMAVVGATIMTQMKKCTNSENLSESNGAIANVIIDADAAKHNQESIAQMSLESLLQSDFTVNEMEFGKELEELFGMPSPGLPPADAENVIHKDNSAPPVVANVVTNEESKLNPVILLGDPVILKKSQVIEQADLKSSDLKLETSNVAVESSKKTDTNSIVSNELPPSTLSEKCPQDVLGVQSLTNPFPESLPSCEKSSELVPETVQDMNVQLETIINDSDIPVGSTSVVAESTSHTVVENADLPCAMTPQKSRPEILFDIEESPAKNTRSKDKRGLKKGKTPKVLIRKKKKGGKKKNSTENAGSEIAQTKNEKPKQKTSKKKAKSVRVESESVKNEAVTVDVNVEEPPAFSCISPKNVLAAVNLQNSPRKLTLRYGLRSTIQRTENSPENQALVQQSISDSVNDNVSSKSTDSEKVVSTLPSNLHKTKEDLIDTVLLGSQVNTTEVDPKNGIVAENKAELSGVKNPVALNSGSVSHQTSIETFTNPRNDHSTPASTYSKCSVENFPSLTGVSFRVPALPTPVVTVAADQQGELDVIIEKLAQQVKKCDRSSAKKPSEISAPRTPSSTLSVPHSSVSPSALCAASSLMHLQRSVLPHTVQDAASETTARATSPLSSAYVSDEDKAQNSKSVKHFEKHDIESLCKKDVTGDSLTVLLNETSLTQMIEAVVKDDNGEINPEAKKDQFRTISPTAGVFSVFDKSKESADQLSQLLANDTIASTINSTVITSTSNLIPVSRVDVSAPSETEIATQNLRAWLNNNSQTENFQLSDITQPVEVIRTIEPVRTSRKTETVCRSLDFLTTSNLTKKTKKKTERVHRKILPKSFPPAPGSYKKISPVSSPKSQRCRRLAAAERRPLSAGRKNLVHQEINDKPRFTPVLIVSAPSTSSVPISSLGEVNIISTPNMITFVSEAAVLLPTPSQSVAVTAVEKTKPSTTSIDSTNSEEISLQPNNSVVVNNLSSSKLHIDAATISIVSRKLLSSPAVTTANKVAMNSTTTTASYKSPKMSTKPVNVSPRNSLPPSSPIFCASAAEKTSSENRVELDKSNFGSPLVNSERATVADSSEEHSLRIVTSDDEKPSITSLVPRKRKSGRKSSPRKKPRMEKFENTTISDLESFLKKIHANDSSKHEKKQRRSSSDRSKLPKQISPVAGGKHEDQRFQRSVNRELPEISVQKLTKDSKIQSLSRSESKKEDVQRKNKDQHKIFSPKLISPVSKEKLVKRRVSLTSIPIPPSKLGGSPFKA